MDDAVALGIQWQTGVTPCGPQVCVRHTPTTLDDLLSWGLVAGEMYQLKTYSIPELGAFPHAAPCTMHTAPRVPKEQGRHTIRWHLGHHIPPNSSQELAKPAPPPAHKGHKQEATKPAPHAPALTAATTKAPSPTRLPQATSYNQQAAAEDWEPCLRCCRTTALAWDAADAMLGCECGLHASAAASPRVSVCVG